VSCLGCRGASRSAMSPSSVASASPDSAMRTTALRSSRVGPLDAGTSPNLRADVEYSRNDPPAKPQPRSTTGITSLSKFSWSPPRFNQRGDLPVRTVDPNR
jgi:hypothetical protein